MTAQPKATAVVSSQISAEDAQASRQLRESREPAISDEKFKQFLAQRRSNTQRIPLEDVEQRLKPLPDE